MKKKLSKLEKDLLRACRSNAAGYHQLANAMKTVRNELEKELFYQKPHKERRLPNLPALDQIKAFFRQVDLMKKSIYKMWLLLTYTMGIRVHEMVSIQLRDVNLQEKQILIHGKGKKDRYVPVLPEIAEMLRIYIENCHNKTYLFENVVGVPYTTRMVQIVFKKAKDRAGIEFRMSPHLCRHLFLTALTEAGWNEAEIMKLSGHADKNSLARYQHLTLENVRGKFNAVIGNKLTLALT